MANRRTQFMQQQKLFLGVVALVILGVVGYFMSVVVTDTNTDEFVAGEHYTVLDEPRRIRGDKIEVMEFFSYGCIHCYNFDDEVHEWASERAADVNFIQTPAVANPQWREFGKAYYAMESLGMLEDGHTLMFQQIHDARRNLNSAAAFAAALSNGSVSNASFVAAFNSNAVAQKVTRADQLARQSRVATVPSLVVHGKYHIRVSGSIGYTRMLDVADFLVAKEKAAKQSATTN